MLPNLAIERLTGGRAAARVEALWQEYVPWVVRQMQAEYEWPFHDPAAVVEQHHQRLAAELPRITGPRGGLFAACSHGSAIGVVALVPVNALVAEVKRLYVRPEARGHGVGIALLERLMGEARSAGCARLRLETLDFMEAAVRLYRSLGFVDAPAFQESEAASSVLTRHTRFMELSLAGGCR